MADGSELSPKIRALEFLKAGKMDEAITVLRPLVDADPDDAEMHSYLGSAYHKKGDRLHSIHHFEEALRLDESARSYFNLGMVYEYSNRIDEAVREFQVALSLDPGYKKAEEALNKLRAQFDSGHHAGSDAANEKT